MTRSNAFLLLLVVVGAVLWALGTLDVFPEDQMLSLFVILAGSLEAVSAGFLLVAGRRVREADDIGREMTLFCLSAGSGAAAIGLALSPLTAWLLPAVLFAAGGLVLILWSPQAFWHGDG